VLRVGADPFDPLRPGLRERLLQALGLSPAARVEELQGFRGGLNDGIWFVREGQANLVLKLVRGTRRMPQELTEAEQLQLVFAEHPSLASDPLVAFPFKILQLQGDSGPLGKDLIAMERAPGLALANVMSDWKLAGRAGELHAVFQQAGEVVGMLHARYGEKQHGDLQASNIFYDQATHRVTLIDVGGMGCRMVETDEEHFVNSLKMVASFYNPHVDSWCMAFKCGLQIGRQKAARLPLPALPIARRGRKKIVEFWDDAQAPSSPSKRVAREASRHRVEEEPPSASPSPSASASPLRKSTSRRSVDSEEDEGDGEKVPWYQSLRIRLFGEGQEGAEEEDDEKEDKEDNLFSHTSVSI